MRASRSWWRATRRRSAAGAASSGCTRCTSASIPAPRNSPPRPPTCIRPTKRSAKRIPARRRKIMILGGGPNRIGQGIEFDYCCVHAAMALREDGFETIMVNCNPETVSTDYDTSDRLYFEPLTFEDVMEIIEKEKPEGRDRAVRRPDAARSCRGRSPRRARPSSAPPPTASISPRTASGSRSW